MADTCIVCRKKLTPETSLKNTKMCVGHTCSKCGDVITDENLSFSTMVCDKPACKDYADKMGW